ncbi:MAG: MarR family transcriptional regulator [Pseudomonadota bacterium]|jgi:DNA-binding MarR family transcriptional regulator|nr:MarR family transcriptional regulator [Pseudomonadota bacterium]
MVEDVVRALGHLSLGTRLRRIGEQLQSETQRVLDAGGLSVQASQCPVLVAVERLGPVTVGDLALALGITQPGATRAVGILVEAGSLEVLKSEGDARVRLVALTPAGTALVARLRAEMWPQIDRAVAHLCAPLAGPLLDQLDALEAALHETPLPERIAALKEEPSL